jgi:NAD(P)-dependent dehydrogenase (short-subunit alcohol dehydrogenase family)
MEDLNGKVAFVTGSAGGIGLGMARAFATAGMKIALADVDAATLAEAAADLESSGATVLPITLDVTDRAGWAAAATSVESALGPVQVLCNNAGVSTLGLMFEDIAPEMWDKVVAINLTGVYNGVHTFLGSMRAAGGGHIVNTSSMGGLMGNVAGLSPYAATKFAVVGLSESLRAELADSGIGVSVLCPGGVRSRLWRTSRPLRGLPDTDVPPDDMSGQSASPNAMDPYLVGLRVLDAVQDNELYVFSHPEMRPAIVGRHERMMAGFDYAETVTPSA